VIRSRTVFVVGAGASTEVGLPTGEDLKRIIARNLKIECDHGEVAAPDDDIRTALIYQANFAGRSGTPDVPGNTSHFVLAGLSILIWHWIDADREISAIMAR
jgi:hypothetical protein